MLSFIVIQIGLNDTFERFRFPENSFPLLFSDKISQTTVLRIEPPWENNSAPALIKTKDIDHKPEPITRTDETKNVTSTNKVSANDMFLKFERNELKVSDYFSI